MKNLEFGSLYKFLVSFGIVLLSLPIAVFVVLWNNDVLLISNEEFELLSEYSKNAVLSQQQIKEILLIIAVVACILFFLCGFVCFVVGLINWKKIQKTIDASLELDKNLKENEYKMSQEEILKKAQTEVVESEKGVTKITENERLNVSQERLSKYMQIEDKCFSKIQTDIKGKGYLLKRHLRIGKYEYDFVGVSPYSDTDVIYEVKYWQRPYKNLILQTLERLKDSCLQYQTARRKNFKCNLMVVVPQNSTELFKQALKGIDIESYPYIHLEIIEEQKLL